MKKIKKLDHLSFVSCNTESNFSGDCEGFIIDISFFSKELQRFMEISISISKELEGSEILINNAEILKQLQESEENNKFIQAYIELKKDTFCDFKRFSYISNVEKITRELFEWFEKTFLTKENRLRLGIGE